MRLRARARNEFNRTREAAAQNCFRRRHACCSAFRTGFRNDIDFGKFVRPRLYQSSTTAMANMLAGMARRLNAGHLAQFTSSEWSTLRRALGARFYGKGKLAPAIRTGMRSRSRKDAASGAPEKKHSAGYSRQKGSRCNFVWLQR